MQTCGICNTQSTDEVQLCPRCGADLMASSKTAQALARMQADPRVALVRVSDYGYRLPGLRGGAGHLREGYGAGAADRRLLARVGLPLPLRASAV